MMVLLAGLRRSLMTVFRSAEYLRLPGTISETWIDFDRAIQKAGAAAISEPWARAATRLLLDAERQLAGGELQRAWVAVSAAREAMISNPHDHDLVCRTAIMLRREADNKISGWRAKAIRDLICDAKTGELLTELQGSADASISDALRMRVSDAVALRDDQYNTTYFKIALRRAHLLRLFILLVAGVSCVLVLAFLGYLPAPFADFHLVSGVVLLGAFGAGFSVAQNLMTEKISAKIPDQQIGAFVVWMRPVVGAAAALVSLALFQMTKSLNITGFDIMSPPIALSVAFVAGFSERFIMGPIGAIERSVLPAKDG